ncbi:DUF3152 domain-containing protein [Nocardioides jensenii]|uniref:DUF3152 domain-containing protein n=1 Tax=Nocardioides jensenii TaxID=1843 RepID=UPI00082CE88A|nr:DUF3152 domain-containing protein [Nocardioides jensenii]
MSRRLLALLATLVGMVAALLPAPSAGAQPVVAEPITNLTAPTLTGTAVYLGTVTAAPGAWQPADATYAFAWLRDGRPIAGATERRYRPVIADIGRSLSVRVTASHASYDPASATSRARVVRKATFGLVRRPDPRGTKRYLSTLTSTRPTLSPKPTRITWRWLRDGRPIARATKQSYRLTWRDVGHAVRVRATATRAGYRTRPVVSQAFRIGHRVPARHVVHYKVETRGRITASLRDFRRLANASLNDPRGWRGAGIAFNEVRSGGSMTLVLAESSWLPRFSSGCSAQWSCRVGRFVVINQLRWQHASPAWNRAGGTLRSYRHMVVNHETGHWLGWSHRSCPRAGAPAPVMQQQSISLQGCRFNPFPTAGERDVPRF